MSVFTNPADSAAQHAAAYVSAILELLGDRNALDVLRRTPDDVRALVKDMQPDTINRPEAEGKWSIGAVIQHLADSELVFGYRLRMVLAHDRPRLEGYDQDRWADRLGYADADYTSALTIFTVLRRANLSVLERASADDLRRVTVHAERGEQTLDDIVRLTAGHDLLHMRQIERIGKAL